MNVTQYIYKSPSSSAVQIGRLDPNTKQDNKDVASANDKTAHTNEVAQKTETFKTTEVKREPQKVTEAKLLDIYA